jgi:uncharacterized membrane protein
VSPARLYRIIASLCLASIACNIILITRAVFFDNTYYFFLNWNLFLSWVPLVASFLLYNLNHKTKKPTIPALVLFLSWFIFFPNALYIITDFLHLGGKNQMLLSFDIITVFSFASTGLFLGFTSLELVQSIINKYFGHAIGWLFAIISLTLGSFGVYLGRFLRWNSWEVITHPISLIRDMFGTIVSPYLYTATSIGFTCVLTIFCLSLYLVYHSLSSSK